MGVGVLRYEARVVGGDAAEPMGACRGHLENAVDRMTHELKLKNIWSIDNNQIKTNPPRNTSTFVFSSYVFI